MLWAAFRRYIEAGAIEKEKVRESRLRAVPLLVVAFIKTGFLPALVGPPRDLQGVIEQIVKFAVRGEKVPPHCLGHVQIRVLIL